MCVGDPRRVNAEQWAAFRIDTRRQTLWQENKRAIRVLALVGDLIRLSETQFVFRLLFFKRTQIGEKQRIRIKCPCTCFCFLRIKIPRLYSLTGDGDRPRLKVDIIPRKPECFADSEACVIEYFEQRVVFVAFGDGGELFRRDARAYSVMVAFKRRSLHIRAHDILQPRGEIVPQLHLLRGDADVAGLPCGVCFYTCVKCFILGGKAPFLLHAARMLRYIETI